jgi:hypothetical protein
VVDQLRDHLGVGFALERAPFGDQLRLQLGEVLDDAVVHHGHPPGLLGMGVALVRRAMGRPPRMPDADVSRQRIGCQHGFEIAQLARRPPPLDVSAHDARHARRIVAAVLQPSEALDQPFRHRFRPDDADDAAHSGWVLCG